MSEKEQPIGLGIREAKQELIELTKRMGKISRELDTIRSSNALFPMDTPRYKELTKELDSLKQREIEVREWYNIGLSERLYYESKRLNQLTVILTTWTIILSATTIADFILRFI